MRIIGLTGGIGSGKSTVARLFGELGVHWVDADNVAREVVEPGQPALAQIAEHFGAEVLQADGSLNRAWLRERVFAEPAEREWLEQLLHPVIREELVRQLRTLPAFRLRATPAIIRYLMCCWCLPCFWKPINTNWSSS